jgi:hypothetical protein
MAPDSPRDPRTGTAVEPDKIVVVHDQTVVTPERTVVVPEAAPPPAPPAAPRRRLVPVGSNTALWVIGFLVVLIAVVAVFIWALAPGENGATGPGPVTPPGGTDAIEPDSDVGFALALPAPDELRTHTVNVAGDIDLLALATTAGAVDSYGGAPVTADGVEVTQLLGDRAFEVSNRAGDTMVVYLPYGIPNEVFVTLGQQITFDGSLSPTSEDLTLLGDASAATAAAGEGAFVIAVPESVHVPGPSGADAAAQ